MTARIFAVAWRLALLALPWQTRWFADASLAGWPWEQGRWSFYVSWFLVAATVVLGLLIRRPGRVDFRKHRVTIAAVSLLVLSTVLACGTDVAAWKPALQWWVQVSLLAAFVWTLDRTDIPRRTLAVWVVVAILPHVALGAWQYAIQKVIGHPWLGIATQLPENPGVSVIEHGEYRVLRMYGGFPHPNIFGGWTAVGFILSTWLAATASTKMRSLAWSCAAAGLAVALLLSYARGAWLAAVVGMVVLVGLMVWTHLTKRAVAVEEAPSFQYLGIALAAASLVALAVAGTQYDHLATRFDPSARLEAKSIDTRVSSVEVSFDLIRRHPLVGTGPNAELLDMSRRLGQETATEPLEPPHSAPLLAFADVGILGAIGLVFLLYLFGRAALRNGNPGLAIVVALLIVSTLDHYPWSLWSGQSLVTLVILLTLAKPTSIRVWQTS
ncbi:MAG: O-antigen ligase family protein [Patescibacteria group bacterium]